MTLFGVSSTVFLPRICSNLITGTSETIIVVFSGASEDIWGRSPASLPQKSQFRLMRSPPEADLPPHLMTCPRFFFPFSPSGTFI